MLIDQLRQVFIAAGDDHLHALLCANASERANHIIGLYALDRQHRPTQQTHHLMNRLDLAAQVVRHGRAIGFVVGIQVIAKSRAAGIKNTGGIVGGILRAQRSHHVNHDAHRAGFLHRAVGQGHAHRIAACKECTVNVAGAINQ